MIEFARAAIELVNPLAETECEIPVPIMVLIYWLALWAACGCIVFGAY